MWADNVFPANMANGEKNADTDFLNSHDEQIIVFYHLSVTTTNVHINLINVDLYSK